MNQSMTESTLESTGQMENLSLQSTKTQILGGENSVQIKRRRRWDDEQTKNYVRFLLIHQNTLEQQLKRNKQNIFNKMAAKVKTRESRSCKSHHQKMMKKFKSIQSALEFYMTNNPNFFDNLDLEKVRIPLKKRLKQKESSSYIDEEKKEAKRNQKKKEIQIKDLRHSQIIEGNFEQLKYSKNVTMTKSHNDEVRCVQERCEDILMNDQSEINQQHLSGDYCFDSFSQNPASWNRLCSDIDYYLQGQSYI